MNLGRTLLLSWLWIGGLAPTAICLLLAVAMAGKPIECKSATCPNRTYGWDLLILPAGTLAPFIAGYWIGRIGAHKKRFDAVTQEILKDTSPSHLQLANLKDNQNEKPS